MLARWTGLNKREKSVLKKKLGRYYSFYQNLYKALFGKFKK